MTIVSLIANIDSRLKTQDSRLNAIGNSFCANLPPICVILLHRVGKTLKYLKLNSMTNILKIKSLALIDFIGLKPCFMLQNKCPRMLNREVGEKQAVSIVSKVVKMTAIRGHFALKAD